MVPSAGASPDISDKPQTALPQYGFGADITFGKLIQGNPYLFRVHTPKAHPARYDGSEASFVAPKYSDTFSSAAIHSSCSPSPSVPVSSISYTDNWNIGQTCGDSCSAKPDPSLAHGGTWHDATYDPSKVKQATPDNATFGFTGDVTFPYEL